VVLLSCTSIFMVFYQVFEDLYHIALVRVMKLSFILVYSFSLCLFYM
jgi:hypothetical protein